MAIVMSWVEGEFCRYPNDKVLMSCSCVLNPHRRYYGQLRQALEVDYEDNYWPEDAVFMERNSRDFVSRNERINANAEAVCGVLKESPHGNVLSCVKLAQLISH